MTQYRNQIKSYSYFDRLKKNVFNKKKKKMEKKEFLQIATKFFKNFEKEQWLILY